MKIQLVQDWKDSWRWLSIHFAIAGSLVQGYSIVLSDYWDRVPDSIKQTIPAPLAAKIGMGLLIAGAIGRIIEQGKKNGNNSSGT